MDRFGKQLARLLQLRRGISAERAETTQSRPFTLLPMTNATTSLFHRTTRPSALHYTAPALISPFRRATSLQSHMINIAHNCRTALFNPRRHDTEPCLLQPRGYNSHTTPSSTSTKTIIKITSCRTASVLYRHRRQPLRNTQPPPSSPSLPAARPQHSSDTDAQHTHPPSSPSPLAARPLLHRHRHQPLRTALPLTFVSLSYPQRL